MNNTEQTVLNRFKDISNLLIKWGDFVDNHLINVVMKRMIEQHMIKILPKYRIKDDISYLQKALYRRKPYIDHLLEIEDKIGTRVVVLKSDDIIELKECILNNEYWEAKITKNSTEEIQELPRLFDYQSIHIVVKPKKNNGLIPNEYLDFVTLEIQIRTLLQHAFAEISHDSTYKGPYKNDNEILRMLSKAMALMEATDDYFCNIFALMNNEKRELSSYLNEVTRLYIEFNKEFKKIDNDLNFSDSILYLLDLKKVNISELEVFCEKYNNDLKNIIKIENGLLFQQPIIILVFYYFINHQTFLKDNWPLNIEALKNIYSVWGTSFENY
jgi:ppGpp synthetase/RelA/SpoT-type nucleotidyltranferase